MYYLYGQHSLLFSDKFWSSNKYFSLYTSDAVGLDLKMSYVQKKQPTRISKKFKQCSLDPASWVDELNVVTPLLKMKVGKLFSDTPFKNFLHTEIFEIRVE